MEALSSGMSDFEDSIQSVASSFNGIDFIVTRNINDFKDSIVKAIRPDEFLKVVNDV